MPMTFTRTFLSATVASVLFTSAVLASSSSPVIPQLKPEKQHAKAAKRVVGTYLRNHYKAFKLNDDFSQKVFQRYLRNLDYNKNFFVLSDVEKFSLYADKFDEALTTGNMLPA
jgi:carboxyl-terminal processing protease